MQKIRIGDFITEIIEKTTSNNQYPVLTSSQEGIVLQDEYFNKQIASKDNTGYKIIRKDQFTYRAMSDTGRFYINQLLRYDVGIVSPAYPVFEVNEFGILYASFLNLFFKSEFFQALISTQSTGSTRVSLKLDKIKNIEICVPSYEDQVKIVDKVNRLNEIISNRRHQLSKYDDLVKSQFIEMFGGCDLKSAKPDWVKIGEVADVVGGSTPKTDKTEFWGGEYYWITPAEISADSFVITKTVRTLTNAGVKSCSLRLLPIGTVLLSSRAPIGKVAIAGAEMYCNQGFKNLICSEKLNSIYAYCLLKFNSDYLNSLGRGATFKEISKAIVDNISVPLPSIELQNEFARFVEQTDKSKVHYQSGVAA